MHITLESDYAVRIVYSLAGQESAPTPRRWRTALGFLCDLR